jgi:hypothetical protein
MAQSIRNEPFRPQPPRKRRKKPQSTVGDRLVCAFCGAVLAFLLWTGWYGLLMMRAAKAVARSGGARDLTDSHPAFWWGAVVALVAALLSAWAGEERMMDAFGAGARLLGRSAGFRRRD